MKNGGSYFRCVAITGTPWDGRIMSGIKSKIIRTKVHQSPICRRIARTIFSVKNQRRWNTIWRTWSTSSFFIGQKASYAAHVGLVRFPENTRNNWPKKYSAHSPTRICLRDRAMVLAEGKLKRSASIAMRRIVFRSFSDSDSRIRTENLNEILDEPKTLADIRTRSRMRITLTLPCGTRGNGTKRTGSLPYHSTENDSNKKLLFSN